MIDIVPTVVPDSLEGVMQIAKKFSFAPVIHIDAADGKFAPHTTWMPAAGDRFTEGAYEAHLMVEDARVVGIAFANAGVTTIIGHVEAIGAEASSVFDDWRSAGAEKVGLATLLQTPLETLEPYVGLCDYVLLMTIARIGVQGIPFEEFGIARIAEFHAQHPEATIAVDGGVSEKNIALLAQAGASHFSVGSAIAKAENPAAMYERLMNLATGAV